MEPDFSGWATKANLECTDGRTIMPGAFEHQDKMTVPLVWQHGHNNSSNILGKAVLEHRAEGVYVYGYFNDTKQGQDAKLVVQHGDIRFLSIFANQLVQKAAGKAKQVVHGAIREVSLVIAGANPGAVIENVSLRHSDGGVEELEDEAIIYTGVPLEHADSGASTETGSDGPTLEDAYNAMPDEQKAVVHAIVEQALVAAGVAHSDTGEGEENTETGTGDETNGDTQTGSSEENNTNNGEAPLAHTEGSNSMEHNVFEGSATQNGPTLTHDQLSTIFNEGKKNGSFKEALLAHADEYGITNIEVLFPDAKTINATPEWITRRIEWVEGVLNGARKVPWSKIKTMTADLTQDSARAKGYIKGNMKKEQFFSIAFRETGPDTVYKKQKLDRDDIVDITDFDVVAWLWVEMRFMLREEVARAVLISDGREVDDEDKIDETKIRPIAYDDEFYTDKVTVPVSTGGADLVEAVLRNRNTYKGPGQPTAYMTNGVYTDMLLAKDKMGRRLYRNRQELASEMNVADIVEVEVMEGAQRDGGDLLMILVNMSDYAIGTTKGGEITTFDDFDIDFNQYKYLIETRLSGALTSPKRAQVFVRAAGGTEVTPATPTFVPATGVVTIPNTAGVVYKNQQTDATLTAGAQAALNPGQTLSVYAVPDNTHYFPHNIDTDWEFTRPAS